MHRTNLLRLATLVVVIALLSSCGHTASAPTREVLMAAPTAAPAVEYEWAPARTASPMPADAGPGPSTGGTDEPNDEPFGDIFFEDYGVNPFIDTEDDHSSTFAVDVDTASYQAARTPSGRFGSHAIRPEVVARPTGSRRSAADVGRASPFLPLGLHGDLRA